MSKIFISHASEDKDDVALPLANLLIERGFDVWLDQWELRLGDSLYSSIEKALSQASFAVVILSPNYIAKPWPMVEIAGLFNRQIVEKKLILPVVHKLSESEIPYYLPMLSDLVSCSTDRGLSTVADMIAEAILNVAKSGGIQQPPEVILSQYRKRMLAAVNRNDIRLLKYEMEDFLRRYPAHPHARILLDEIDRAFNYYERDARERPLAHRRVRRTRTFLGCILGILLLAGFLYLLFRLFRLISG